VHWGRFGRWMIAAAGRNVIDVFCPLPALTGHAVGRNLSMPSTGPPKIHLLSPLPGRGRYATPRP
jgi:hypothetical protein